MALPTTEQTPFYPDRRTCPFDVPSRYTEFREAGWLHQVTIWDG